MKIIAVNGSPRTQWNTAQLLQSALSGAAAAGVETQLVHLYDLSFRGCISCFACKKGHGETAGRCVMRDGLTGLLEEITVSCGGLLLGSPIYLGDVTSATRAFLERLVFPSVSYSQETRSYFAGALSSGAIYTMGLPADAAQQRGYDYLYKTIQRYLQLLGGTSAYMTSADTYQFDDYAKYNTSNIDVAQKTAVKRNQFPVDMESAYELGKRLALASL